MPKKNRVAIYEYLFKEGVLVAEKDFYLPKHPHVEVPNLHVIKAMQVPEPILFQGIIRKRSISHSNLNSSIMEFFFTLNIMKQFV